ncbi:MAG TPA: tail fiber domain-containing protein [Bacteroidia bacterium]|jgi:hypothetical protein|nr:tail fiber domain-containing protein [Bacteroidia bacterium]
MKTPKLLNIFILIALSITIQAQNVGINNTGATPNATALLDLNTGNNFASPKGMGLLIPNVSLISTTDIITVPNPINSLLVYNTNAAMTGGFTGYWYYSTVASAWLPLGNAWLTVGNSGTVDGTNFIGTTDDKPFNIRINNIAAGRIENTTNGNANTFFGYRAGQPNLGAYNSFFGSFAGSQTTGGIYNTGIGSSALQNNTVGMQNTALGFNALIYNTTGGFNVGIGLNALGGNNSGSSNTAVGVAALGNNVAANGNVGIGYWALTNNSASNNVGIGCFAMQHNITGTNNVALGVEALWQGTQSNNNTALGHLALFHDSTGANNNSGMGYEVLYNNFSGSNNVASGYQALFTNVSGSNNTAFGYQADVVSNNLTNATAIGNGAKVSVSNTMVFGNASITDNYFTGNVHATCGILACSDARYKKEIKPLTNLLTNLRKLEPVNYYFKTEQELLKDGISSNAFQGRDDKELQIGFIAQQVEPLFPELVHTDKEGYKSIDYSRLTPILVEAIKEQQQQIDELKKVVAALSSNNIVTATNRIAINLSDKDVAVLNPNTPNPFAEQTVIEYNIPSTANLAQLLFYDAKGKQIKTINITEKGQGQLILFANDLSNGIYNYALIIDGQLIDTKKMIKQ